MKSWLIINFRFIEEGKTSWRWKSRHILKSKTSYVISQSIISSNSFTCSPCFTSMNKARDSRAMNAIRAGMEEWTSKTCIRFKRGAGSSYAYFKKGGGYGIVLIYYPFSLKLWYIRHEKIHKQGKNSFVIVKLAQHRRNKVAIVHKSIHCNVLAFVLVRGQRTGSPCDLCIPYKAALDSASLEN